MKKGEITLNVWFAEQRDLEAKFRDNYKKRHEMDPAGYPLALLPGDWDAQFECFCEDEAARRLVS